MDPGRRQQIGASGHCRGPVCALTRYLGKQKAGKSSGDLSLLSLLAWNCIILILVTFLHFGLIENDKMGRLELVLKTGCLRAKTRPVLGTCLSCH